MEQGPRERVISYVTRLEGAMDQLLHKLKISIEDQELQMRDRLFHGLQTHIWESIRYFHVDPYQNYNGLLSAA